ncbi:3-deoxy-D-manno-octulosonic acid kinase [Marinomonas posidonica]|uniref:3-deoxy-D-manno-octulosonic acid kinase n=1 Tax=Marinomonas posidonica (strain CECT 7376 / NCIMB 14433 / IVIA-Po-181) TaxID=491952 RepID=F6CTN9_MARPP|nr:3-deoxy-D-manno-octulosonic acid kinase [Marinomonas posidonica]AEF55154.1 3-deoxy-D-manno-octulosonic acid kinase [Marinomonas posidonica IVIA-Po-181]
MPHLISTSANTYLIKSDADLAINQDWFNTDYWQQQNAIDGTGTGRGDVWFIKHQDGQFVLRRYRRGGLMAKLTQRHFIYTGVKQSRPWLELSLLERMRQLGLPVPQPIAGRCKVEKGFYQADLITATIANAVDLFDLIKQQHNARLNWHNIGHTIRRFHDNGIDHTDLNCHNIMIDADNKVWLIDFDKCQQRTPRPSWMKNNLDRLKRSFDKETQKHPTFSVTDAQWTALLEGYHG